MNSIMQQAVDALRAKKRSMRLEEVKAAAELAAAQEQKKAVSDHRIATKLARIQGVEPPPPLPEIKAPEPAVAVEVEAEAIPEPEPKKPVQKKAAKKAPAKKRAPKKAAKKDSDKEK